MELSRNEKPQGECVFRSGVDVLRTSMEASGQISKIGREDER